MRLGEVQEISTALPVRPLSCRVKIRELISDLTRAGFENRGGKGNHRNFEHRSGRRVTLSGKTGEDAKPYQEREVKQAIEESRP